MDVVADAEDLRTEFTSVESIFIGWMEVWFVGYLLYHSLNTQDTQSEVIFSSNLKA